MSTTVTSFFTAAIASGFLRSSTIERLPALSWPNIVPVPSRWTGRLLIKSPSGASTLITSAPMSAIRRAQCGPAMVVEKSRTLTPLSGRALVSVMGSPGNEDQDDDAYHQDAADPFAGRRPLVQDDVGSDEGEDELDLSDRAHQGGVLESHGEHPAGRAQHTEDANPARRAPIDPDLGELRPVAAGEIDRHQHDLDGVHAGEHGDAAHHEGALRQQFGGFADGAGCDRGDCARQPAGER